MPACERFHVRAHVCAKTDILDGSGARTGGGRMEGDSRHAAGVVQLE